MCFKPGITTSENNEKALEYVRRLPLAVNWGAPVQARSPSIGSTYWLSMRKAIEYFALAAAFQEIGGSTPGHLVLLKAATAWANCMSRRGAETIAGPL